MLKKKYLIGVSGGPDSMALLNMFRRQAIAVCHVNYAKRESAIRDEKIVENFCRQYKINFFCLRLSSDCSKQEKEKNFQAYARKVRYDFYEKCAQEVHCQNILLGHTLDDSIETAYDQLNRRVLTLFYGIRPKNVYHALKIYRPLIYTRKKALERYCQSSGIEFGIDETNFSNQYKRNIIRKLINAWSPEKFLLFRNEIRKRNDKLKKINRIVTKNYYQWQKTKYLQSFIFKFPPDIRLFILYRFLQDAKIKCRSRKKLYLIEDFISKNNQLKELRVQENKFLKIIDNHLLFFEK